MKEARAQIQAETSRAERLQATLKTSRGENRALAARTAALETALKHSREQAQANAARLKAVADAEHSRKQGLQVQLNEKVQHIAALKVGLEELQIALDIAHAQWNETTGQLRQAQFHQEEQRAQIELEQEQIEALETSHRELDFQLSRSQEEASRWEALAALLRSGNAALRKNQLFLQKQLDDTSQCLVGAGKEMKESDLHNPSIVELIASDIRDIARPSLFWRVAGFLGLLQLAPSGLPTSAAERCALAKDLEEGLREILATLSSASTPAKEAAAELARLFRLRRQTRHLRRLLQIRNLFKREAPAWNVVHWARSKPSLHRPAMPGLALFDGTWYLAEYPDVAEYGINPLDHYVAFGQAEGRNPNAFFDSNWYLSRPPILDPAEVNPLQHYWESGAREGRDPHPLFDTAWYVTVNPDVAAIGLNPLLHYLKYGIAEGRDPHPLFDTRWYCATNPEVAGLNPASHYLKWGGRRGRAPHPLFHAAWYMREYGDVAATGLDPLIHYLNYGAAENRRPHPLFDIRWYLQEVGDRPEAAANPLRHYLLVGARERISPTPLFDPRFYADSYPDTKDCDDLFIHYLTQGWRQGYCPSPTFNPSHYLRMHPDVAQRGLEPLTYSVAQI
jgi:hypothetical protein